MPIIRFCRCLGACGLLSVALFAQNAPEELPVYSSVATRHPVIGTQGMVVSREGVASEVGLQVLKDGGNAVDAAVAVGFAMAVTLPQAGNLGGGGFMLIHDAASGETVALDYREKAPLAATRDMYLDDAGEVNKDLSRYHHLAAGVPGTIAGLALALETYGTLSLEDALAPAIHLAEAGFPVGQDLYSSLVQGRERLTASPVVAELFYKPDGRPYGPGETLRLPVLAETLRTLASEGPEAFYGGALGELFVADMERGGGIITLDDLKAYAPKVREPVRGTYRGYTIASMPPPSSGGIHIVQILNILEGLERDADSWPSARAINALAEAMKYAYADRSKHLGDSDFEAVPTDWLTSKAYGGQLREKLNLEATTPSAEIAPGTPSHEGLDTTSFVVMDGAGNAVANTYTINFSFGSKLFVPELGFFLNNEMDDFSAKPGVPNAYGLIGGEKNAIEAEKRMLSSMSPTIVFDADGKPFLLTGSRGGSQIITSALQVILNVIDHEMNIAEAVAAPRIHHQWLPDVLLLERGFSADTRTLLEAMGHELRVGRSIGTTNSILHRDGVLHGAADPRRPDTTALGF